jgi:hypothetical protein
VNGDRIAVALRTADDGHRRTTENP